MPETGPRNNRHNSSGPNAAPSALQAKSTVLKMDSSMNRAAVMAAALMTKMAKRSSAMLLRFTCGMSCEMVEAHTSSWLSAVDMIADKTAAMITPDTTGGNKSVVRFNNTVSLSAIESTKTRPHQPAINMPL